MASNKITVYQNNSNTVTCTITGLADLTGYSATLTVKADSRDAANLFEVNHTDITGLVITFETSPANNNIAAGVYTFEVNITDGTHVYTTTQDVYEVLESVKH